MTGPGCTVNRQTARQRARLAGLTARGDGSLAGAPEGGIPRSARVYHVDGRRPEARHHFPTIADNARADRLAALRAGRHRTLRALAIGVALAGLILSAGLHW